MGDTPKVEFALGSEVSPGHFFKSSFARSFVVNCRDSKSLDYELVDNGIIVEDKEPNGDNKNNNFFSLENFTNARTIVHRGDNFWKTEETVPQSSDENELEKLRKQCQLLTEENQRLQRSLTTSKMPQVQTIDNVFLQTQVDTLQWQLKQTEANRQMYRSLMEQVVRFLDRARKSLDILHEKNSNDTHKNSIARVPRSRSVHAVHADSSPSRATSTCSSSSSGSSRFTRAKSVTQISPSTGFREFTWTVLRRTDPILSTPPFKPSQDLNKTHDGIVYRRPKQSKLDPDDVPPEKLSQEAFRLMRTVQSLLSMREPDLARIVPVEDGEPCPSVDQHHCHEISLSSQNGSFVNSTTLQEANCPGCYTGDRANESSTENSRTSFLKSPGSASEVDRNLDNFLPGIRRSLDATSLISGSSKTTEEEDDNIPVGNPLNASTLEGDQFFTVSSTSTPNRRTKKAPKTESGRKSLTLKPDVGASSAEDESGFSSMSSFQEVGLPVTALSISPIKGCHTEIGLPEIPLEKTRHRRWSSNPTEIQAHLKRHRVSFTSSQTTAESLSVWV